MNNTTKKSRERMKLHIYKSTTPPVVSKAPMEASFDYAPLDIETKEELENVKNILTNSANDKKFPGECRFFDSRGSKKI